MMLLLLATLLAPATAAPAAVDTADTGPARPPHECNLGDVGATWVPPDQVTCPYGKDDAAIAACTDGGHAALVGGQGFATLTEAIDAAAPGGTVVVCPGVHMDRPAFTDLSLVAADPTPDATVLEGAQGDGYWISAGGTSAMRGMTMGRHRGVETLGTVLSVECLTSTIHDFGDRPVIEGVTLEVRHSTFVDAMSTVVAGQNVLVEDSRFERIHPFSGNYVSVVKASFDATFRRTAFIDNYQSRGSGTAIRVGFWGTTIVEDCWFEGNVASEGQGIIVYSSRGEVIVSGTTFLNNRADRGTVAVSATQQPLTIRDSSFFGNVSSVSDATTESSGLVGSGSLITLERCRIEGNSTGVGPASVLTVKGLGTVGTDLVVRDNFGGSAAVVIDPYDSFSCTCCGFGIDGSPQDNAPADALVEFRATELPLHYVH